MSQHAPDFIEVSSLTWFLSLPIVLEMKPLDLLSRRNVVFAYARFLRNASFRDSWVGRSQGKTLEGHGRGWVLSWLVASVLFLSSGLAGLAEERFVTKSGDSLVGEVVSRADGFIVIRSKIFGELRVSEDKISIVPLDSGDVKDVSAPHSPLTLNPPASTSSVNSSTQADATKEKTRELFNLPDGMKIKAGLGVGILSGETSGRNYSTSLQVDYDSGRYVNSFSGEYMYGKVQGLRVTDLYKADGRTDRCFGDVKNRKYFSMYEGKLSSDRIHLLDKQVELLVGLGMDVHKGKVAEIQFTAGYSSEWEDFLGDPTTGVINPGSVHRNKAFLHQELNLKLNEKFTLKEDGYYMIESGGWGNHELRIDTTISYLLSSHLSLDLVFSLEFDNTSAIGVEDDISRLTLQFGYQL